MITTTKQDVNASAVATRGAFCQAARMSPFVSSIAATLVGATLLVSTSVGVAAGAETWRFDPVHTQVVFFADHLGFSHGIGRIKVRDGWLRFDADEWSAAQVDVTLDIGSLDMGDAKWTQAVQSARFLDVARWPTARFVSTSVEKTDAGNGLVHGQLTLHGVSKPVTLAITFNRIGRDPYAFKTKAGFSARTILNRFDFGIERYREVVGSAVELRIEVEAIRDKHAVDEENENAAEEH